ncbi:hypothetical protein Trydic_g9275 [Trypoxylus dichotomus]
MSYPLYSFELEPSDYHLIRSLNGKTFHDDNAIELRLHQLFFAAKSIWDSYKNAWSILETHRDIQGKNSVAKEQKMQEVCQEIKALEKKYDASISMETLKKHLACLDPEQYVN